MLLCDGWTIYQGTSQHATDYFAAMEYVCPDTCNPCDYFMSIMSSKRSDERSPEEKEALEKFKDKYTDTIEEVQKEKTELSSMSRLETSKTVNSPSWWA
jgi:hypothetical protein